jgi:hypothetical protein
VLTLVAEAVSSIVAVVGTLLGATLTYLFQRRSTDRAMTVEFLRQLRAERLAAYAAFSTACTEYRRGQYNRWHQQIGSPDSPQAVEARQDSYRLKSIAQYALAQIQLVAHGQDLMTFAEQAYRLTSVMHDASDARQLEKAGDDARAALELFIKLAARQAQSPQQLPNTARTHEPDARASLEQHT